MNRKKPAQLLTRMTLQKMSLAVMSPAPIKKTWRRRGIEKEIIYVKVLGMMMMEGCS